MTRLTRFVLYVDTHIKKKTVKVRKKINAVKQINLQKNDIKINKYLV